MVESAAGPVRRRRFQRPRAMNTPYADVTFFRLWHHRATTESDGSFALVTASGVKEVRLQQLLTIVCAAERLLDPALSTSRIRASQEALEKSTIASEGLVLSAIRASPDVYEVNMAARTDPVTHTVRILGTTDEFPSESTHRALFVSLPVVERSDEEVLQELEAKEREYKDTSHCARGWRAAILAKCSLEELECRPDQNCDARRQLSREKQELVACARRAVAAERAALLRDFAACKYHQVRTRPLPGYIVPTCSRAFGMFRLLRLRVRWSEGVLRERWPRGCAAKTAWLGFAPAPGCPLALSALPKQQRHCAASARGPQLRRTRECPRDPYPPSSRRGPRISGPSGPAKNTTFRRRGNRRHLCNAITGTSRRARRSSEGRSQWRGARRPPRCSLQ